ncbi:putative Queuosine, Q, salvage protein family [uncultured archaeon]|nr:putative Queuosine, Q, salvage protein family [uncultured archaeon]
MGKKEIIDTTAYLVDSSRHVKINDDAIRRQAESFAQRNFVIPEWKECFPTQPLANQVELFCLANTTNFAFTNFETGEKYFTRWQGKDWSGAYGMYASVNKALERGIPLTDPKYLATMSLEDVNKVFSEDAQIPLAEERRQVFNEVGQILSARGTSFTEMYKQSAGRLYNQGRGFVERLVDTFPSFDDSTTIDGRKILFYKRAQLAPAEIQGRLLPEGITAFEDVDELTAFADYVLPKGMRTVGILEYSPELAQRVDAGQLIPRESREELEIRAASIHAFDRLLRQINTQRQTPINTLHLDYAIWAEFRKQPGKHHLTKTTNY